MPRNTVPFRVRSADEGQSRINFVKFLNVLSKLRIFTKSYKTLFKININGNKGNFEESLSGLERLTHLARQHNCPTST